MFKVLKADKDTYLTDRVVNGIRQTAGNVGSAGSLDLFKLYGITASGSSPNIELSRLLVHFDLDPIRNLVSAGKLDTNSSTFACHLKLFDVFGGQTTPRDFVVTIHPLSRSFDEGLGRDVVFYADYDVSNFLTGSRAQGPWIMSGAGAGGALGSNVDYLTSAVINNVTSSLEITQHFITGEEDLYVDVTQLVSATLAGLIPDEGFRVSLTSSLESDTRSYFVKRFASRTAYNEDKRPRLLFGFNDSIQDDTNNLQLDSSGSLFLHNYAQGTATNLLSGSSPITGSNSLLLNLITPISGGFYSLVFTGSQHTLGRNQVTGVYSASVYLSSTDQVLSNQLLRSGSIRFTPVWGSLDGTIAYLTGSTITVYPPVRGPAVLETKRYAVSVTGLRTDVFDNENLTLRLNLFDESSPRVIKVKQPINAPGVVIRNVYYSIREEVTDAIAVPFDANASQVSSDGLGMYFQLDASNLTLGRSYVVDIKIVLNGSETIYRSASPAFRIVSSS